MHTCAHTHTPPRELIQHLLIQPSREKSNTAPNASNPAVTGTVTVFKSCRKTEYYPPQKISRLELSIMQTLKLRILPVLLEGNTQEFRGKKS